MPSGCECAYPIAEHGQGDKEGGKQGGKQGGDLTKSSPTTG